MRNVCKVIQQERSKEFKFMQNYNEATHQPNNTQHREQQRQTGNGNADEKKNKL